jgi:rhodanese-related sulfurtransferase
MAEGNILLIDVREPDEYAVERIDGAVLCPLSTFDARTLPPPGKAKIVFHCGSGIRSAKALAAANAAGLPVAGHLAGGLKAWKQAGLPTNSTGLDTGMSRGKA